ncbi:hypothetical protein AB0I28_32655 [Phytomonospora sp. NPDC050363]|uniref:hypothetical protein n=1 Tax=Phytomonospora sp. NPDC050363 TaxID=3155642 RepID=UPI0033F0EE06
MDATWAEGEVCSVCPALKLRAGAFDVSDRPGADSQYDRGRDYRVNVHTGAPTCVHPYRVGLPAAAYASAGVPLPAAQRVDVPVPAAALDLPEAFDDLEAWFVARLSVAPDGAMGPALREAESTAQTRFTSRDVAETLRRVLGFHLVGRR